MSLIADIRSVMLDAPTNYHPVLMMATLFYAAIHMRTHPPFAPSSPLHALIWSFIFFAYPGNLLSNIIARDRVPSVFLNPWVVPAHCLVFLLVNYFPMDLVYKVGRHEYVKTCLCFLAWVDNFTSAYCFVLATPNTPVQGFIAAMLMHWGGSALAIFRGIMPFQASVPLLIYCLLSLGIFYLLVGRKCANENPKGVSKCIEDPPWYEILVILGALRFSIPPITLFVNHALDNVMTVVENVLASLKIYYYPAYGEYRTGDRRDSTSSTGSERRYSSNKKRE